MFNTDSSALGSLHTMADEISPTIPQGFPKSLMPSRWCTHADNLCEGEIINLSRCYILMGTMNTCDMQFNTFIQCKRQRVDRG